MVRGPNVFILSVDSLPYWAFSEASEQLASMINGVNFTQAIAPASFTSSAMPALATGSLTDQIPAWGLPKSGSPIPIAEVLEEEGYNCGLWTDNHLFGAAYNYDRGFSAGNLGQPGIKKRLSNSISKSPLNRFFWIFETAYFHIVEPLSSIRSGDSSFYRHASELNELALDWLDNRPQNDLSFCWIHYMDTHHPYQPPSSYLDECTFSEARSRSELGEFTRTAVKSNGKGLSDSDQNDLLTVFNACCRYISDELARFIRELQERDYYNPDIDTLIVTADHGEVLERDKYGMLGHVPPAFWEDIVHVPLIVGLPNWEHTTVNEQVSLLDLKQIVLQGADVIDEFISPTDFGRPMAPFVSEWEELDDGSITTYRGIRRDDGQKLFGAKREGEDRILLTEVDSSGDDQVIAEITPKIADQELPACGGDLLSELAYYGDAIEFDTTPEDVAFDIDERHLRDLGYIE